jgi:hypothetical protein
MATYLTPFRGGAEDVSELMALVDLDYDLYCHIYCHL